MHNPTHFYTIEKEAVAEYKERGSKFLAYAFPLPLQMILKAIKNFKRGTSESCALLLCLPHWHRWKQLQGGR
jgi:hypothetical protein